MDTRSVLGVPALRSTFLDHVPAPKPREGEACNGPRRMTHIYGAQSFVSSYVLQDDPDDLPDDDDDEDDPHDDDEDEDEEGDGEDVETWQVRRAPLSR